MKAGLHVITEKLMAHSVHECKEMARVADADRPLLAVGHQRHYNILYANAVDSIQRGLLGEVHYIRAQWHRGNLPGNDSWQQPLPAKVKPEDPQAERCCEELKTHRAELAAATRRGDRALAQAGRAGRGPNQPTRSSMPRGATATRGHRRSRTARAR